MTVAELISELEKFPLDWTVETWEYCQPSTWTVEDVSESTLRPNTVMLDT